MQVKLQQNAISIIKEIRDTKYGTNLQKAYK